MMTFALNAKVSQSRSRSQLSTHDEFWRAFPGNSRGSEIANKERVSCPGRGSADCLLRLLPVSPLQRHEAQKKQGDY